MYNYVFGQDWLVWTEQIIKLSVLLELQRNLNSFVTLKAAPLIPSVLISTHTHTLPLQQGIGHVTVLPAQTGGLGMLV